MNVDTGQVRQCLKSFDFKRLFIQELNWSHCTNRPLDLEIDGDTARISPLAELGGVVVYQVELLNSGDVPSSMIRRQIENKIKQLTHEHIIIFVDSGKSKSVWQWIRRGSGFQTATREHTYYKNQPGDSLMAKLDGIAFDISELDIDDDGNVKVIKVVERLRKAFDVEKVTKRFYDEFKKEHDTFRKFLKGIEEQEEQAWYVSIMLNRLMFIYFIQKKGFLDRDTSYLANKLRESKRQAADQFYKKFLVRLFFEGFAKEEEARTPETKQLLGDVPYLNGGIFQRHKLEEENPNIAIPDAAFEKIITFFDGYSWHLDYRPLKADNEINPDVLGYIFEKYINQKQMGAYYTKEDITDYICKNTIISFLFDKLENMRYDELHPFPMRDVEPYIYDAVIQKEYLPTETEREYQARQKRYLQIENDFAAGKVATINDLITYNLDIRKFAEDWVASIHDPVTLRAFYFHCLTKVTVLDPAVGSGAFLFAALNMLEPLYIICLDKMEELGGPKYQDFADELKRISQHPNRHYFILKSIIVNNLFGVDIMEEAVEICKLRLFLKLVAQVDDVNKIEPLPDIDFNIRAGNTLVGYTHLEQIRAITKVGGAQGKMDLGGEIERIDQSAQAVDRAFQHFRALQTIVDVDSRDLATSKGGLRDNLGKLQDELSRYLAGEYGIDVEQSATYERWLSAYQPFHWFVDFYGIMKDGGFDAVIGNPPYVAYSKVKSKYTLPPNGYESESCGNLYCFFLERAGSLLSSEGHFGMIVPVSLVAGETYRPIAELIFKNSQNWVSTYSNRPGKLFQGVEQRLAILISSKHGSMTYTTYYQHWYEQERDSLIRRLHYSPTGLIKTRSMPYKVGDELGRGILAKIVNETRTLNSLKAVGRFGCWYHDGPTYWIRALPFEPNIGLKSDRSNHYHRIPTRTEEDAYILAAILSSSTFYFYFKLISNCRDFGSKEFDEYRIGELVASEKEALSELGEQLGAQLKDKAGLCTRVYPSGVVEYEEYYPQIAKGTIDQIDRVLAHHYGFTDNELDFIIHYDIKYRMSREFDAEEQS